MALTVSATERRRGGAQQAGRGGERDPWALTCLCRTPRLPLRLSAAL